MPRPHDSFRATDFPLRQSPPRGRNRCQHTKRPSPKSARGRHAILQKLVEAEGFETFLGRKYTGTKRFGLDGAESLVPAMEQIIKRGGALGVKEIVIGMPHRGRLNVLANVMGKPYEAIFHEFRGGSSTPEEVEGSGDVKYHLGSSSDRSFDGNEVHLSLTANPSHLEAADPVVLGKVRAKQNQRGDGRTSVLPVLLHGDAAFAGQGVVAECLGLTGATGHRGGVHVRFARRGADGEQTLPANVVLVATGRHPCTEGLGAAEAGLQLDALGRIGIDDRWRTGLDNVYAIGDAVARPMLAHKAEDEGCAVAERPDSTDTPA